MFCTTNTKASTYCYNYKLGLTAPRTRLKRPRLSNQLVAVRQEVGVYRSIGAANQQSDQSNHGQVIILYMLR